MAIRAAQPRRKVTDKPLTVYDPLHAASYHEDYYREISSGSPLMSFCPTIGVAQSRSRRTHHRLSFLVLSSCRFIGDWIKWNLIANWTLPPSLSPIVTPVRFHRRVNWNSLEWWICYKYWIKIVFQSSRLSKFIKFPIEF